MKQNNLQRNHLKEYDFAALVPPMRHRSASHNTHTHRTGKEVMKTYRHKEVCSRTLLLQCIVIVIVIDRWRISSTTIIITKSMLQGRES